MSDPGTMYNVRGWARLALLSFGAVVALLYALVAAYMLVVEREWLAASAFPLAYWWGAGCILRIRRLIDGAGPAQIPA